MCGELREWRGLRFSVDGVPQGVNCQERTREKLMESLRETLAEAIDMNRHEALAAALTDYAQESVLA